MAKKPILFSSDMVRAILDGTKTQTRRVIKPQPELKPGDMLLPNGRPAQTAYWHYKDQWWWSDPQSSVTELCPYGQPGNTLWVRETWATPGNYDDIKPSGLSVAYQADIVYRASEQYPTYYKWRPSIFMPRWASRITLGVVDVRVERVQDISHEDAIAEGVNPKTAQHQNDMFDWSFNAVSEFKGLWDSINVKRGYGWDANPWVWVVEFEVQS